MGDFPPEDITEALPEGKHILIVLALAIPPTESFPKPLERCLIELIPVRGIHHRDRRKPLSKIDPNPSGRLPSR